MTSVTMRLSFPEKNIYQINISNGVKKQTKGEYGQYHIDGKDSDAHNRQ